MPQIEKCEFLGNCPNRKRMEDRFLKHGEWIGCAGCCLWCKSRKDCEIACPTASQVKMDELE